jgi:phosphatidylserine/phosphatidylglycerophosphate/cardiolipin synthase-like enzyme
MAKVYGPRPPWHDVQLCLTGPVVGDVETVFRERWDDPQRISRSPLRWAADEVRRDRITPTALPPQLPDPAPTGLHPVQLLRTYPRRAGGYPFAPRGERSVARGFGKAVSRARALVYIEDQYLWAPDAARVLAKVLRRNPALRVVAVLPRHPDQDGRLSEPPNLVARARVMRRLSAAAPGRVAFYGVENADGTPVYVHAKVCVVDDSWASVGSDNVNRRSWTHDSELSAAVCHQDFAHELREELAREHLGLGESDAVPGRDDLFDAFAAAGAELQRWHDEGRRGPRPRGQLRAISDPPQGRWTQVWSRLAIRYVYDPDGRPLSLRLRRRL